jgi:cell division septum initiation protein DivIVA
MIARDDITSLRQRVLQLTQDVQQLEREFESAVESRSTATDDAGRRAAVREAAVASGKLGEARQHLSDTERALAKAEGDEYER